MRELPRLVAETEIETTVPVTVWRRGDVVALTVTLGELEKAEETGLIDTGYNTDDLMMDDPDGTMIDAIGLAVAPISPSLRQQFNIPDDTQGAVVTDVVQGGQAQEQGLIPGDVIVDINQVAVANATDIEAQITAATEAGRGKVLLLISRAGDIRFVPLSLEQGDE